MILYTPIPLEEVWAEKESGPGNLWEIPYERGVIEVQMTSASTAKIIRLRTHTLNDFLHPSLQPGKEIRLKWTGCP